ncbi:hypothetical protein Y032_0103g3563 [Ancylostoma ceylanicum]|nr:hypothetical protein Y032_0103g3563 [Ancylostoma ceylanicum]
MATMFLTRAGVIFSYLALDIYLFGDLAIYSTTVPKSLMNIICAPLNSSVTPVHEDLCRPGWPGFFTRFTGIYYRFWCTFYDFFTCIECSLVYRLCVVLFISVTVPMVIIGITRTKYLQLATSLSRWTAFILMIVLAIVQIANEGPAITPPPVDIHGFGSLFGVTVYSFMCHHSIPSLITPMTSKSHVFLKLFCVYIMVMAFYFTLSMTGSFAFVEVLVRTKMIILLS